MSKTVAFFNGFYLPHFGGVERYTYNLAQQLILKGYQVIVITSQHKANLPNEDFIEGIKIYRLPVRNIWKNRYPFLKKNKIYKELIGKIINEKIDYYVVNTRFYMTSLLGAKIAKEKGKEAIIIEHGSSYLTLGNPFADKILNQIERLLIDNIKKKTTLFYGVSKEAAAWLTEFNIKAQGVLYNAVDIKDYEKYPQKDKQEDKLIISYSGRLQPKMKGVEMLLSAFDTISREYTNLELIIAGDGPLLEPMRAQYKQKNIRFLGFVNHEKVMEVNALSDVFVLMSRSEGFSTAMLEAALLKNVIITTPTVGGARDIIPDESFGYIIENDETILVSALRKIVNNQIKMKKIKNKVSERVRGRFTWQQSAESLISVFQYLDKY